MTLLATIVGPLSLFFGGNGDSDGWCPRTRVLLILHRIPHLADVAPLGSLLLSLSRGWMRDALERRELLEGNGSQSSHSYALETCDMLSSPLRRLVFPVLQVVLARRCKLLRKGRGQNIHHTASLRG